MCGLQKEKVFLPPIARSPDVPHGCLIEALLLVLLSLARNKERQKEEKVFLLTRIWSLMQKGQVSIFTKNPKKLKTKKKKPTHICQNCLIWPTPTIRKTETWSIFTQALCHPGQNWNSPSEKKEEWLIHRDWRGLPLHQPYSLPYVAYVYLKQSNQPQYENCEHTCTYHFKILLTPKIGSSSIKYIFSLRIE